MIWVFGVTANGPGLMPAVLSRWLLFCARDREPVYYESKRQIQDCIWVEIPHEIISLTDIVPFLHREPREACETGGTESVGDLDGVSLLAVRPPAPVTTKLWDASIFNSINDEGV